MREKNSGIFQRKIGETMHLNYKQSQIIKHALQHYLNRLNTSKKVIEQEYNHERGAYYDW